MKASQDHLSLFMYNAKKLICSINYCFRHSYSVGGENNLLMTLNHHKKACRAVRFSDDGNELYTVSKDKSIHTVDLNTGAVKSKIPKAHR